MESLTTIDTRDTLTSRPAWLARRTPLKTAYMTLHGDRWIPTTYQQQFDRIRGLSGLLRDKGVVRGASVAILGPSNEHWHLSQNAIMACGAVVIGLDAQASLENLRRIIDQTEPEVLIVERLSMISSWPADLRNSFRRILSWNVDGDHERPLSLTEIEARAAINPAEFEDLSRPGDLATVVFTSGTTGTPKGIPYTHGQILRAVRSILRTLPELQPSRPQICWLPLAHLFQRIVNQCALDLGAPIYFVPDPRDLLTQLPVIQPQVFIGVPRFFEKVYAGIQAKIADRPLPSRVLIAWARRQGRAYAADLRAGRRPSTARRIAHALADRWLLRKIRAIFGARVEFLLCGSAPLPTWLLEEFHALGLLVLEGYGVSENVTLNTLNRPDDYRLGSVGKPLSDNEIRLADDGEVLVRGEGVFTGYWKSEGEGPLRDDGFLATGDLGAWDEDGFLYLTGRKSEVFKTSNGKKVAPAGIEPHLTRVPGVENALVLGAGRKCPVAILTAPSLAGKEWNADDLRSFHKSLTENLRMVDPAQRPAGVSVAFTSFTVENGELTSNLKLRRREIERRRTAEIDRLYDFLDASDAPAVRREGLHLFIALDHRRSL
jgi:long-chain acyl-CoA synthetase